MDQLEIEIKAYCGDFNQCRKKAESLGAERVGTSLETDVYFNHPARDFGATDEALRIRRSAGLCVLTYKGPKIGTRSKTRVEQEVAVEDFDSLRMILLSLGFIEYGSVMKVRETYTLGGIHICFDRVEGLGGFIELEMMGTDRERIERELFELASGLGLDTFERRSYLELLYAGR